MSRGKIKWLEEIGEGVYAGGIKLDITFNEETLFQEYLTDYIYKSYLAMIDFTFNYVLNFFSLKSY